MEPDRTTEARLLDVQAELQALEPIFHSPKWGSDRATLEAMTDSDFWEVGASGSRYSREHVFEVLRSRTTTEDEASWEAREFFCQELAPANYLLTYTLHQGHRVTRRATVWRRVLGRWQVVYHQGTLVVGPDVGGA